ncbi:hypothetical protein EDB86DRAFT_2067789 [Lactarius hatsudake]|nr:hypothetical protein EDB86DRAFT_2067789 [Lactarius hatsudake]
MPHLLTIASQKELRAKGSKPWQQLDFTQPSDAWFRRPRMVGHEGPSSLRGYLNVKFTAPVAPGDGLETSALNVGTGPDGVKEVTLEVKNTRTGKVRTLIPRITRADRTSIVIRGGHAVE